MTLRDVLGRDERNVIALGMLGSIHLQLGMHERAVRYFTSVLETDPRNPVARFQLGMAELLAGRAEEALEAWNPMLDLENEFMANFHSALALAELGRHDEARGPAATALRNMPPPHPLYPRLVELQRELAAREPA